MKVSQKQDFVRAFLLIAGILCFAVNALAALRPGLSKVVGQTIYQIGVRHGVATPTSDEELADWPSWATAVAYKWNPEWPKRLASVIPAEGEVVIEDEVVFIDPDTKEQCRLPVTEIDTAYMHTYATDSIPRPGDGHIQTDVYKLGQQYWGMINKFKLGANIRALRSGVFANSLVMDTCAVIPATVDSIYGLAFANTQFLNMLKFEYSPTPLVFEDHNAVKIDIAPQDSLDALIACTSNRYLMAPKDSVWLGGEGVCPELFQHQGEYCSSVFYSGIPINQLVYVVPKAMLAVKGQKNPDGIGPWWWTTNETLEFSGFQGYKIVAFYARQYRGGDGWKDSGPATVAPCVEFLHMDRDFVLNLYDNDTPIANPVFTSPFGPFGFKSAYIGEHVSSLCDNFFFSLGMSREGAELLIVPSSSPLYFGPTKYESDITIAKWIYPGSHTKWDNLPGNGGYLPVFIPNVYVGRNITPTNTFQYSPIERLWFGVSPLRKDSPESYNPYSPYPLTFWNWDESQLGERYTPNYNAQTR